MISTDIDFSADERASDSPFVDLVWRSNSGTGGAFHSIAERHWSMVVTRIQGKTIMTVRGPEIRATPAFAPDDAEFFGILFKPGAFMPKMPAALVMDRHDLNLPDAGSKVFTLNGSTWQFPDFENADTFVDWLVRDGVLVYDPLVEKVLQGRSVDLSPRTVQRRILQATGLTQSTIQQIERARYATTLLKQGVSILDTVYQAGYFDQPHLSRSLKHYIGLTPAQLSSNQRTDRLSFLYKTAPLLLNYDAYVR